VCPAPIVRLSTPVSSSAGPTYGARLKDLDRYIAGDEYVVTDELGIPLHPESYSDEFTRMLKRTGQPKIRLDDSRHTTLSLMEKAGVPISIISKWAGHYDSSFTMKTYVHASGEDLKQGRQALAVANPLARSAGPRGVDLRARYHPAGQMGALSGSLDGVNQFLAQAAHALAPAEVATEIPASSGVPCRAAGASARRLAGDVAAPWCAAARAGHDRALVQMRAGRPW
jgi:hypothetical protein